MSDLASLFLIIHILTAIVAFGATGIVPLIAAAGRAEPAHGIFALHLTERIQRTVVVPAALTMPVSGLLLVWTEGINLFATHWLLVAISVYVVAMSFAILVQIPTIDRMIAVAGRLAAMTRPMAAPGAASASPAHAPAFSPSLGARLDNPAAEMASLGRRAQLGGMLLTIFIVIIVSLMVAKPGF